MIRIDYDIAVMMERLCADYVKDYPAGVDTVEIAGFLMYVRECARKPIDFEEALDIVESKI